MHESPFEPENTQNRWRDLPHTRDSSVDPPIDLKSDNRPPVSPPPGDRAPAVDARSGDKGLSTKVNFWTTITTALVAVIALGLSIVNTWQANSSPVVTISMPPILRMYSRIAGSYGWDSTILVAPSFALQRKSDLTAVITTVNLDLEPPSGARGSKPHPIFSFTGDVDNFTNDYRNVSDPAPIIVSQDKPQASHLAFSSIGTSPSPGTWTFVLSAQRGDGATLSAPASCIVITEQDVQVLHKSVHGLMFRNDIELTADHCYRST
jgi:hypothetical protein